MPDVVQGFAVADRIFTFDRDDSASLGWGYLPLFAFAALADLQVGSETPALWDWSFIGSLHSDWHRGLRAMVAENPGQRYFVHCYVQNTPVKLVRAIADSGILSRRLPPLSLQIMGCDRYWDVVGQSWAVVDIDHPSKTGMTMRTIKALLDGKKLITINAAVRDSNLYHPSRIETVNRKALRISQDFLTTAYLPIPNDIRRSYHINGWLKKLLS